MTLLLFGLTAAHASAAEITISAPDQVIEGQTFDVIVDITGIANLYAAAIDFTYNPQQWQVVAINSGNVIPVDDADPTIAGTQTLADVGISNTVERDNGNGTSTFSQWQSRLGNIAGVNAGGTLVTLQLKALQAGQFNLTFGNKESGSAGIIMLVNDGTGNVDEVPTEIPFTVVGNGQLDLNVQPAAGGDIIVDIINVPVVDKDTNIAVSRPLRLTALAGEEVTWTVTILKGTFEGWPGSEASRTYSGTTLDVSWPVGPNPTDPDEPWNSLLPNGDYQISVSARDLANNEVIFNPINVTVYNMPIKIFSVSTMDVNNNPKSQFNPGEMVRIEIGFLNLENRDFRKTTEKDERPLAIVKVERVTGSPEMLGTAQGNLLANDEIWLTSGNYLMANAVAGTYTVTTYVWKGLGQEPMSMKDSSVTFTVN